MNTSACAACQHGAHASCTRTQNTAEHLQCPCHAAAHTDPIQLDLLTFLEGSPS